MKISLFSEHIVKQMSEEAKKHVRPIDIVKFNQGEEPTGILY